MKTLFTTLLIVLVSLTFAQTNDIVVFSESGAEFTLFVNSIKQNEEPRANVKAKDLKGENFVLRMEFVDESIPKMTKKIWTESKDVELTAVIKQNKKGKYVLRYMGETPKNPDTDIYTDDSYVNYEDPEADSGPDMTTETSYSNDVNTSDSQPSDYSDDNINITMDISADDNGMSLETGVGEETVSLDVSADENGMSLETGAGDETVTLEVTADENGMSIETGVGDETVSLDVHADENGMSISTGTGEESVSMDINIDTNGRDFEPDHNNSETVTTVDTQVEESSDGNSYHYSSTTTTTTTSSSSSSSTSGNVDFFNDSADDDFENDDFFNEGEETNVASTKCDFAMSSSDFNSAKQSFNKKSWEDDKLEFAKNTSQSSCMTSEQIRDMAKMFDFESTRLEFAIFAYDYAFDKANYSKVNEVFDFEMTIDELEEAISKK